MMSHSDGGYPEESIPFVQMPMDGRSTRPESPPNGTIQRMEQRRNMRRVVPTPTYEPPARQTWQSHYATHARIGTRGAGPLHGDPERNHYQHHDISGNSATGGTTESADGEERQLQWRSAAPSMGPSAGERQEDQAEQQLLAALGREKQARAQAQIQREWQRETTETTESPFSEQEPKLSPGADVSPTTAPPTVENHMSASDEAVPTERSSTLRTASQVVSELEQVRLKIDKARTELTRIEKTTETIQLQAQQEVSEGQNEAKVHFRDD
eukprot:COSAG03_NODE_7250_length_943_cov_1.164692_1_plen_269_part_00